MPMLAVKMKLNTTISKQAQNTISKAAEKIREENHTDIPHTMATSERDILHEVR